MIDSVSFSFDYYKCLSLWLCLFFRVNQQWVTQCPLQPILPDVNNPIGTGLRLCIIRLRESRPVFECNDFNASILKSLSYVWLTGRTSPEYCEQVVSPIAGVACRLPSYEAF